MEEDVPITIDSSGLDADEKMNTKVVAAYCIAKAGTAPKSLKTFELTPEVKCTHGRSPLFFYEAWYAKKSLNDKSTFKISDLVPSLTESEKKLYSQSIAIELIKGPECTVESPEKNSGKVLRTCPDKNNGKAEDVTNAVFAKILEDDFEDEVAALIYNHGEKTYQAIHGEDKRPEVHTITPDIKENKTVTPDVVDPKPEVQTVVKDVVEPKPDPDCNEELNKEIAALLADDQKNIIGLQYELTVLKMAALATESKTNSIEGVIRKQSKKIDAIDDGIINKMNVMYKKHGLPEDAAAISSHLKQKSSSANYFAKDKRFFNEDSSAFLLAYQELNENSGIKDSDVSVLWFMDKVSEKAKAQSGKYSAAHNLTNLSTRLAQYTSAIDPKQALSKPVLDEMVKKQNGKIEEEFLDLIQKFKTSNPVCYAALFGDDEADTQCNLNVVEAGFSQLLAINSRIKSTDMVSIDSKFSGGIDKTRFSLSKYVDEPEKVQKKREPATIQTALTPESEVEIKKVEAASKVNKAEPVKEEKTPITEDELKSLHFTEE